jgi:hypothetical protein
VATVEQTQETGEVVNRSSPTLAILAGLACASAAHSRAQAQLSFIVADRTANVLWLLQDRNFNGVIENPAEVFPYFTGANAAGTPAADNLNAMAVSPFRTVAGGDQVLRQLFAFGDRTLDHDVEECGESRITATAANASGFSFAFPTGMQFVDWNKLLVVNAGNGFGPDGVYLCQDLTGDGTYQQTGEVTFYIGEPVFGPGNGAFSPQEIWVAQDGTGYLRNSSSGLQAIYRFKDANANNRADDPGEFTEFFTSANASGILPSAGFALAPDVTRPGAVYTHQIATGGIDQIIRCQDLNNDLDANDADEAVIAFSSAETGLTVIDLVSLPDGLYMTDNSGKRIVRLHDLDDDGLFNSAGERTDVFTAGAGPVLDIRQIVFMPPPPPTCGFGADFDGDGDFGTDADIEAFFACLGGNCCCTCLNVDMDGDGDIGTDADIESFFRILGGSC